jgi:hypothetical protein
MNPSVLRQFWSLIDTLHTDIPLALDDRSLVQWLMRQMRAKRLLSPEETDILSRYIGDRLPLIREMGHAA